MKEDYDIQQMQEEKYGLRSGHPTDLTVVLDAHKYEADKDFAGIVALLPQAKPQRVRSSKNGPLSKRKAGMGRSRKGKSQLPAD